MSSLSRVSALEASAGSGKTYALSVRFLKLLAACGEPGARSLSSILALTFTNAAAEEMKKRVVAMLKSIALYDPASGLDTTRALMDRTSLTPEIADKWLEVIFRNYSGLWIQTIDSLYFRIVSALSRDFNILPDPEADFDEEDRLNYALDLMLSSTKWPDSRDYFSRKGDFFSIDPQELSGSGGDEGVQLWERVLRTYVLLEKGRGTGVASRIREKAVEVFKLLKNELGAPESFDLQDMKTARDELVTRCAYLSGVLKNCGLYNQVSRFSPEKLYESLADPVGSLASSLFGKDTPEKLFRKDALKNPGVTEAFRAYLQVRGAMDRYLLVRSIVRVSSLSALRERILKEVEKLAARRGIMLGGWWTRLLRGRIRDRSLFDEACLIMGADWRHILIDEFQDTSRNEWEVLREAAIEAVSRDGGTFFYVGDVKQAIYAWRGGDWRLFAEPLSGGVIPNVPDDEKKRESLPNNYRSAEKLVEFFNSLFSCSVMEKKAGDIARIMAGDNEALAHLLEKDLKEVYSAPGQQPVSNSPGQLVIREFENDRRRDFMQESRDGLIPGIADIMAEGVYALRDIAVLTRTNDEATDVTSALAGAGIAAVTEKTLRIDHSPITRALSGLLAWLDDPGDNLALYAFCSSPLVPGGEEASRLILMHPQKTAATTLKQFKPDFHRSYVEPFLVDVGLTGPYAVLVKAVDLLDLRNLPLNDLAWVEKILETAFAAEEKGILSLSSFMRFWKTKGANAYLSLPESLDAVRVTTIHKAKGLEYPVVFIPFLSWPKRNSDSLLLIGSGSGATLPVYSARPRASLVEEHYTRKKATDLLESFNLLYVALTRAEERLVIHRRILSPPLPNNAEGWLQCLLS